MAEGVAYLKGGPCDGKTRTLTPAEADTGELACKGALYRNEVPTTLHDGDLVFTYAGKVKPPPPTGVLSAPHALGGWAALRKSVNRGMPDALHYSQGLTAATLRSLARTRRVGA